MKLLPGDRRYRRVAIGFCSKAPSLQQMGTDPSLQEDESNAKRDKSILRRLRRGLRHLRVSSAERGELKSYLSGLGSEMALDARIELDG